MRDPWLWLWLWLWLWGARVYGCVAIELWLSGLRLDYVLLWLWLESWLSSCGARVMELEHVRCSSRGYPACVARVVELESMVIWRTSLLCHTEPLCQLVARGSWPWV